MGLTWEEHGSYMGGTTMKEKDKGMDIAIVQMLRLIAQVREL